MTRAEAKAAMDAGNKIGWENGAYAFYELHHEHGPYVFVASGGATSFMNGAWDNLDRATILPECKTRQRTDLEILAIQTKPNRVIRAKADGSLYPSSGADFAIYILLASLNGPSSTRMEPSGRGMTSWWRWRYDVYKVRVF